MLQGFTWKDVLSYIDSFACSISRSIGVDVVDEGIIDAQCFAKDRNRLFSIRGTPLFLLPLAYEEKAIFLSPSSAVRSTRLDKATGPSSVSAKLSQSWDE